MYDPLETGEFAGYVDEETKTWAANLNAETLLAEFRAHNMDGAYASLEGNKFLMEENYLVADALGRELAHRREAAQRQTVQPSQSRLGKLLNKLFHISV